MTAPIDHDRLFELLLSRGEGTLTSAEAAELANLLASPGGREDERLLLATELAMLDVEGAARAEVPVPSAVRERLMAAGAALFAGERASGGALPGPISTFRTQPAAARGEGGAASGRRVAGGRIGWVAAAACLALAVAGWWPTVAQRGGAGGGSASALALRGEVDGAGDRLSVPFKGAVDEFSGAGGEVVWSDRLQKGYMRLTGVKPNDPAKAQYQLWIIDPARDSKPVDGGVFDIAGASGEVIVPIDAKLTVRDPKGFAITREQPGGVVVSGGPLLVVALRG